MSIKPQHLEENDTVCAVTLSRWWPGAIPDRYKVGKQQLEKEFGIKVIEWSHTMESPDWIYLHPEARAEDLMNALKDPEIKAIISSIWGEESIRILPYINWDVIKNNPKIFMWFSDSTITHFIFQKAWVVSFYGPSMMAWFAENWGMFKYMIDSVRKVLFSSEMIWEVVPNKEGWTSEFLPRDKPENQNQKRELLNNEWRRWLQGSWVHNWKLIGWCIDVFPFMQGTEIWPTKDEWKNKILILETSEEKMSTETFERIIRNLGSQWILHQISGILLGRSQYDHTDKKQINYDESLMKIVNWEFWLNNLPIVTNMDFGHTDPIFVLPLWCKSQIDCDNQKFIITENACQ